MSEHMGSRRAFLRGAAASVVGAAMVAGGVGTAEAGNKLGEITLDVLLLTYFGALTGENISASYTLGRAYDTPVRFAAWAAPDLRLRPSVPAGRERFFAGEPFEQ